MTDKQRRVVYKHVYTNICTFMYTRTSFCKHWCTAKHTNIHTRSLRERVCIHHLGTLLQLIATISKNPSTIFIVNKARAARGGGRVDLLNCVSWTLERGWHARGKINFTSGVDHSPRMKPFNPPLSNCAFHFQMILINYKLKIIKSYCLISIYIYVFYLSALSITFYGIIIIINIIIINIIYYLLNLLLILLL